MPPKKKKKPDALGQPRAGMRDSAYELGGSGSGGGGYSPRRAPKLKPSSARPSLKPFKKPSKKLKLPPKARPLTKAEARKIAIDKVAKRVRSGKGIAEQRRKDVRKGFEAASTIQNTAGASSNLGLPSPPVSARTRNKIKIANNVVRMEHNPKIHPRPANRRNPFTGKGTLAQTQRKLNADLIERTRREGIAAGRAASSAGSPKKPATARKGPKKPVTPSERGTGSRRGVPVGTNQKTNAIKRAAAAKKKPGTASNPNDSAARAKVRSRKSSAKFDAKVKWGKEFYKSRRATTPKPTKKTTKKTKKKGK